ncbi:MAG: hypothetical protein JOZ92_09130, partial [Candidatus Dormibacteraeota bacterium]|nr:hypothetical protein [Candidatus Dormibacteraeota bacterium]
MKQALVAFGMVALLTAAAAAWTPLVARAVTQTVTPQASASYSNPSGVVGWSDPNGPPATPSSICNTGTTVSEQCDREQFQLLAGTSPTTDVFTLTVTVGYTNNNTSATGPNCLDVAIEDSTASTVYAKATCAPPGASVTIPSATLNSTYTVEIDGNAANGGAVNSSPPPAGQPFSYTVSSIASTPAAGPTPTPT